ncbi:MAG: cbb3-type cytochrome c oxidase subunit 3 [Rickettsiales bacterium]|nr:cbb3-type cytochrome c oxidase subunit 3 [Rickettsiales bacterium]
MIDLIADYSGVVGLLFFFSVFIVIAIWAFRPSQKPTIESYKYIPLAEEKDDGR